MIRRIALSALAILASTALSAQMPARASSYHVVYSFKGGIDGLAPFGSLTYMGGKLWGTAQLGSLTDEGVVFAVDPKTGVESVLYSFQGGSSDGARPEAGLIDVAGTLYGTTNTGGPGNCDYGAYVGCGTVFAISQVKNTHGVAYKETVVHTFQGGSDGIYADGGLLNVGGTLYGTTLLGGTGTCDLGFFSGCGTLFSLNPNTGQEQVIHSFFGATDGAGPQASLINIGHMLYGTTYLGGKTGCGGYGCGTVFSYNLNTNVETVLYSFTGGSDGGQPASSLINVGGMLYGTTYLGGTGCSDVGCGTVFSVNPKTGAHTVVYAFKGRKDGGRPAAGLINVSGILYGTTVIGGDFDTNCSSGCGTVFALNPRTGTETVLQAFRGLADGANPYSSLINVGGSLYGTTEYGGVYNQGAIFVLTP
jgi:uncharacterized repeat protein (TIGR03803 family)